MGVYVYVIQKSSPIRGVKGLDAPIHRMVFTARASDYEETVSDTFLSQRMRRILRMRVQHTINSWGDETPKYYCFAEKQEDGIYAVFTAPRAILWYDCDKALGKSCGYLFIKGKNKSFLTQEQFVALYKEATGVETFNESSRQPVSIVAPNTFAAAVTASFCKSRSIPCSVLNTAVAGCSKELADCI